MNKFFTLLVLSVFALRVCAQKPDTTHKAPPAPPVKESQPYGIIDTADLELKSCDFEKDANAMVLFDKADVAFDEYGVITFIRHKRIKIFNDNGKDEANINIPYIDGMNDVMAETINLNGNTIEFTPVDEKLIYKEKVNKYTRQLIFTFPAVKAGSVIELQYKWKIYSYLLPAWNFQSHIPSRYSEIDVTMASNNFVTTVFKVSQDFSKKSDNKLSHDRGYEKVRALSNIRSFKIEPFMTSADDNLQRAIFRPIRFFWATIARDLLNDEDFGKQLDKKLTGEDEILTKVGYLKDKNLKIDSIFNMVKHRMAWDKKDRWFTDAGIQKAWDKKLGNSAEINLILYHLLNKAGIEAFPVVVSTPDHGIIDPADPDLSQFNKAVVYLPRDTAHYYLLDATSKYDIHDQTPLELLSSFGFIVAPKTGKNALFSIQCDSASKQAIFINADIKPNGKMSGSAEIVSSGYNRGNNLKLYDDLGEKEYIKYLADGDNNLKISSLKLQDVKTDSLPLTQRIQFDLNLSASDDNYIYFNPNLLTSFGTNPFLSENRYSNIDFIYSNTYYISGLYKIPEGYKVDVLPKNQIVYTEDKGMSFKRIVGEQDGAVMIRYVISRKRTTYTKEEYAGLYQFYKKMFEMLNEQIVLKKS